ncbi:MAG: DUF2125 domain-containing protein [Pseudomonadota bacterium]
MTYFNSPKTWAGSAAVCLLGSTAMADITAEAVWEDWTTYMSASGYEMTADESRDGDDLVLTNIAMTTVIPEEDVTVAVTMAEMTLTDNGNGTVSIIFPETLPMTVRVEAPGEDPVDVAASYTTTDWAALVAGDPGDLTYTYSASSIGLTVDEITVDQASLPMSAIGKAELSIADLAGSSQSKSGPLYETAQKITTGAISYIVDVTDPDGAEGRLVVQGGAEGMDSAAVAALPEDGDMADMAAMIEQGFSVDGALSFIGGSLEMNFNEPGNIFQMKTKSASSELGVTMNADGLAYSLAAKGQDISLAGTDIPLPVEISAQDTGFGLKIPISARDELQPFSLDVTLGDFAVSELIWSLIDPTSQLPRDPATLTVGMVGTMKLLVDILDPETMAKMETGDTQPGELHSLEVTDLKVSAAGAELLGGGSFTFDNSDLTTFGGMPAPTGKLDLSLSGGNGLLDKLVNMGLIPEGDAGGVRMMMGLFAVPGDAPDTLNSTIEVQGNGQIFANGQRIQ